MKQNLINRTHNLTTREESEALWTLMGWMDSSRKFELALEHTLDRIEARNRVAASCNCIDREGAKNTKLKKNAQVKK